MPTEVNHEEISDEKYPVVVLENHRRAYAFTLKRTSKRKSIDEPLYINHLNVLMSKGVYVKEKEFELESGLHMHGILELPTRFNYKLLRYRGWHLHLVEIYDYQKWMKYINKHKKESGGGARVGAGLSNERASERSDTSPCSADKEAEQGPVVANS